MEEKAARSERKLRALSFELRVETSSRELLAEKGELGAYWVGFCHRQVRGNSVAGF